MADFREQDLTGARFELAPGGELPGKECLRIVLNEEREHRLSAERDLTSPEKEN